METVERTRSAPEPRQNWPAALVRDDSVPRQDSGAATPENDPRAIKLVETEGRIFQARLSYDPVEADVFVEILDPTTGDVVRRLPAETAADESADLKHGGTLVNRIA